MMFQIPTSRNELLVMARLTEQCERYDEMLVCMKRFVRLNPDLGADERNLLSVAYKYVIGTRRGTWRAVTAMQQKEEATRASSPQARLIAGYKKQIEAELGDICTDILTLLDKHLIPAATSDEAIVFYYKMKGDYHRYYAEVDNGEEQRQRAFEAYTKATQYSKSLKATSPIRLGLALNFSVFYYEILKSPDKGCQLARSAFDEALADPDIVDEEQHKEASLIMQLLRENLSLWTDDTEAPPPDDGTKCEELDA